MADPTEMRVKEQRRAEALRANLKRRKTQSRVRDASEADAPAVDGTIPPTSADDKMS